ncbi:hypothetical protein PENTCL1PPCAC_16087, partial [Pristionchus entomophagus]
RMTNWSSLTLVLLCAASAAASHCPTACRCKPAEGIVRCEEFSAALSFSLASIPANTTVLHLKGYTLNSLSELPTLPSLASLFISHGSIELIPEGFLDSFPLLRHLSLGHNELRSLHSIARNPAALQILELRHNKISFVSSSLFDRLPSLHTLDLSFNDVRSLPPAIREKASSLEHLRLHANPLHCDCRLKPFLGLISSHGSQETRCDRPKNLRDEDVTEISPSQFSCAPAEAVSSDSKTKTLRCVYGESAIWLYKEKEIDHSLTLLDNGDLEIPRGADEIDFSCATDRPQSASRSPRHVTASTQDGYAPSFTFKSQDNTFREGTPAKLHCEVTGKPRPTVEWFYRNQRLVNSRKHELSNGDQILKVFPFLETDVGSYLCRVANAHGRVEHTVRVDLLSSTPPSIVDAPVSVSVNPGEQVTLRCRANGVPRPAITWFFEGAEIPRARGRFGVSQDGTELTISHASRQDDGVFACMAANTVGSIMADARVTVKGVQAIDASFDDATLKNLVDKARMNVNRAINQTKTDLTEGGVKSVSDMRKLFRFAIPAQAAELTKAREIYEETFRLVNAHVDKGLNLRGAEISGANVSFELLLAPAHVQTIMELTGCQNGLFKNVNPCSNMCFHMKYRSYDGQCNNIDYPQWGAAQTANVRLLPAQYENGFNTPIGWNKDKLYNGFPKPNARLVSRQIVSSCEITPHHTLSSFVMQWGQVVDHDITHTPFALSRTSYTSGAVCNRTCDNVDPCFNIQLLPDDPKITSANAEIYKKFPCMEFERSGAICGSGETSLLFQRVTQREQMNILTSFLDASFLYGSTEVQALELRDLFGDHGLMRFDIVSAAQKPYLPFEKDTGMDCRRNFSSENPMPCFLAGDVRANEQVGLTAMHTVFLREHNRLASKLLTLNPLWDGEKIFQETRKIIGAVQQHITYSQWLPIVLGKTAYSELLGDYMGYNPNINSGIANVFATAAFRFAHTLINPKLARLDKNFTTIPQGDLPLHKAFFAPELILSEGGIDPLLRGLFATPLKMPKPSQLLNSELTEKLFNRNVDIALDLASLNIQRSRDHGLPGYADYRRFCNLSVPVTWTDMETIIKDADVVSKLRKLYGHPANIDVWVGGITERRHSEGLVGPLFACIIADQFKRLRDGDRFWYENPDVFTPMQLQQIKKSSLSRLLCDNGDDITRVQRNAFMYPGNSTQLYEKCENLPEMNLAVFSSCCDAGCEGSSVTEEELPVRRHRRTLGVCEDEGVKHVDGHEWTKDKCTKCKCEGGTVWCAATCK